MKRLLGTTLASLLMAGSALAAGTMSAADLRQRLLNRYAKPAGTN